MRILLTILLPIVLPLLAYLIYIRHFRPQPVPGMPPEAVAAAAKRDRTVAWSLMGVSVVLIAGMLALGFTRGVPPGTKLIAPHMEDGRIVPSQRLDQAE